MEGWRQTERVRDMRGLMVVELKIPEVFTVQESMTAHLGSRHV